MAQNTRLAVTVANKQILYETFLWYGAYHSFNKIQYISVSQFSGPGINHTGPREA